MRVWFVGKCPWVGRVVTGGDRFISEVFHVLASRGAEVSCETEPRFPVIPRMPTLAVNLWSLSLNGWHAARRKKFASSIVFQDFSSRLRLFLFNRVMRGRDDVRIVSLVQGYYHMNGGSLVRRRIEEALARAYLGSVDLVLANSRSTASEAIRLTVPPDRIRVVNPGLDEAFLGIEPRARKARGQPVRILFVGGQCKPIKGLEYLVSAVELLGDRDVRLTVVGEDREGVCGPFVSRLREWCREHDLQSRIRFTGRMESSAELIEAYCQADIFVLPSLWEGFGVAVLEAMRFGLPVVASDAGGVAELIKQGRTGLVVPPKDPRALAGALALLIDDEPLWKKMSAAAAEEAKKGERTWRIAAEECASHVEELWRGGSRNPGRSPGSDRHAAPQREEAPCRVGSGVTG